MGWLQKMRPDLAGARNNRLSEDGRRLLGNKHAMVSRLAPATPASIASACLTQRKARTYLRAV